MKGQKKGWKNKPPDKVLMHKEENNAFFWQFFVAGAEGFLNVKINGEVRMVNGFPIKCHSLHFADKAIRKKIQHETSPLSPGSVVVLSQPPDAINVGLMTTLIASGGWLRTTIDPGERGDVSC